MVCCGEDLVDILTYYLTRYIQRSPTQKRGASLWSAELLLAGRQDEMAKCTQSPPTFDLLMPESGKFAVLLLPGHAGICKQEPVGDCVFLAEAKSYASGCVITKDLAEHTETDVAHVHGGDRDLTSPAGSYFIEQARASGDTLCHSWKHV